MPTMFWPVYFCYFVAHSGCDIEIIFRLIAEKFKSK